MTSPDFAQAEADAEAEITTLLAQLVAAVKGASHVDPTVQAAADKLEVFLAAAKAADPVASAPVPAPPVDSPPAEVPPGAVAPPAPADVPVDTPVDPAP